MREQLVIMLIQAIFSVLTPELIREFVLTLLNFLEEKVLGTKSKVDDAIVLPLISVIKKTLTIN